MYLIENMEVIILPMYCGIGIVKITASNRRAFWWVLLIAFHWDPHIFSSCRKWWLKGSTWDLISTILRGTCQTKWYSRARSKIRCSTCCKVNWTMIRKTTNYIQQSNILLAEGATPPGGAHLIVRKVVSVIYVIQIHTLRQK